MVDIQILLAGLNDDIRYAGPIMRAILEDRVWPAPVEFDEEPKFKGDFGELLPLFLRISDCDFVRLRDHHNAAFNARWEEFVKWPSTEELVERGILTKFTPVDPSFVPAELGYVLTDRERAALAAPPSLERGYATIDDAPEEPEQPTVVLGPEAASGTPASDCGRLPNSEPHEIAAGLDDDSLAVLMVGKASTECSPAEFFAEALANGAMMDDPDPTKVDGPKLAEPAGCLGHELVVDESGMVRRYDLSGDPEHPLISISVFWLADTGKTRAA
jgi:hypothetical protein